MVPFYHRKGGGGAGDSGNHNGNIEDFDFCVYSHLWIENEISNPFLASSSVALVSMEGWSRRETVSISLRK